MSDFEKSIHMKGGDFMEFVGETVNFITNYLENIRERPVLSDIQPGWLIENLPANAPNSPEQWENVLKDVDRLIMPSVTHWQSPRFHGYFPTGHSYPSIVANLLCDGIGSLGINWMANPACTELELVTLNWLGKMIGLPQEFLFSPEHRGGGCIQASGSEATFMAVLCAKSKKLANIKDQLKRDDDTVLISKLVAYCSSQAHSSVPMAGVLSGVKFRMLDVDSNYALCIDALEESIKRDVQDGLIPFCVVATLGTTRTCAFDAIDEIGSIARKYDIWLHIDAAYAGTAFICPEYRHLMKGIEFADSFTCGPHKWLLINNSCTVIWYRDSKWIDDTLSTCKQSINEDRDNLKTIPEYRQWQISTGRPFRSLRLWFVFRLYGVENLQQHIRRGCALAKQFEALCLADGRFEIIGSVQLGVVCFRLKTSNQLNERLLDMISKRKNIFLLSGVIKDNVFLRLAIVSKHTNPDDVEYSWNEIKQVTDQLLLPVPSQNQQSIDQMAIN